MIAAYVLGVSSVLL